MPPNSSTPQGLKFLNQFAQIHKTGQRLPHWSQDRATYFLTFRLADSLPSTLLREWSEERSSWKMAHPLPWSAETDAEYHKLFSSQIDHHLGQGLGPVCWAIP